MTDKYAGHSSIKAAVETEARAIKSETERADRARTLLDTNVLLHIERRQGDPIHLRGLSRAFWRQGADMLVDSLLRLQRSGKVACDGGQHYRAAGTGMHTCGKADSSSGEHAT